MIFNKYIVELIVNLIYI